MPRGDRVDLMAEAAALEFCRKQRVPQIEWDTMPSRARAIWRSVALAVVMELEQQEEDEDGIEEEGAEEEGEGSRASG